VANATVAVDGSKALEVNLKLATEVALNHDATTGNGIGDASHLLFAQLTSAKVTVDAGFLEDLGSGLRTNSENVGKRRFDALLVWDFDA